MKLSCVCSLSNALDLGTFGHSDQEGPLCSALLLRGGWKLTKMIAHDQGEWIRDAHVCSGPVAQCRDGFFPLSVSLSSSKNCVCVTGESWWTRSGGSSFSQDTCLTASVTSWAWAAEELERYGKQGLTTRRQSSDGCANFSVDESAWGLLFVITCHFWENEECFCAQT